MAEYIAREWSNGDIVTASNLNQIENGVEAVAEDSEFLVVNVTETTTESGTEGETEIKLQAAGPTTNYIFDKTWQQIYDAFPKVYAYGQINGATGKVMIEEVAFMDSDYAIYSAGRDFVTDSPNGYPSTRSSSTGTNA